MRPLLAAVFRRAPRATRTPPVKHGPHVKSWILWAALYESMRTSVSRRSTRGGRGLLTVHAEEGSVAITARPRRRFRADWGVQDFIDWAEQNEVNYVVLRWPEDLPNLADDDDLDILVADEDIEKVLSVVEAKSTVGVACDVYSVSGRLGTKYKGVPYYPPHLAKKILDRAVRRGNVPIPSREHYFYSLAYHAVYHKGRRSDLSRNEEKKRTSADSTSKHSHFDTLCGLRDELGLSVSIDFESLADFLHDNAWEPGLDLLRKLGEKNGWVRRLYEKRAATREAIDGIGVIILRNWAVQKGWAPQILVRLQQAGFIIVAVHELTGERQATAHAYLRGGNWGSSREYPINSGGPAMLIAVFDPTPRPVAEADRAQYPHMSNGRIIEVKRELRSMMNKGRKPNTLVNSLHTSDDESEAVYYLELIVPEVLPSVRKVVTKLDKRRMRDLQPFVKRVVRRVRRVVRQGGGTAA